MIVLEMREGPGDWGAIARREAPIGTPYTAILQVLTDLSKLQRGWEAVAPLAQFRIRRLPA